jgi:hypothetical protein
MSRPPRPYTGKAATRPYTGKSYKWMWTPTGYKEEQRARAEIALGHPLSPDIEVHHINKTKNGGPIVVCENHSYHMLLHARTKSIAATGTPNNRKCVYCKQWDTISNMSLHSKHVKGSNVFYHQKCRAAIDKIRWGK